MLFLALLGVPVFIVSVIPHLGGLYFAAFPDADVSTSPVLRAMFGVGNVTVPEGSLEGLYTTFQTTTTPGPMNQLMQGDFWTFVLAYTVVGIFWGVAILAYWIAQVVYVFMYKSKVVDRRPPLKDSLGQEGLNGGDFKDQCYDCCDPFSACLNGAFCMSCRCGDTYETVGVMGYWTLILSLIVLDILYNFISYGLPHLIAPPPYPAAYTEEQEKQLQHSQQVSQICNAASTFFLIVCCFYFAKKRAEVRTKLGGGKGNLAMDFLCLCCCTCCSVIQEGKSLDFVQGVQVDCCCNLVGDAVAFSGSESE